MLFPAIRRSKAIFFQGGEDGTDRYHRASYKVGGIEECEEGEENFCLFTERGAFKEKRQAEGTQDKKEHENHNPRPVIPRGLLTRQSANSF